MTFVGFMEPNHSCWLCVFHASQGVLRTSLLESNHPDIHSLCHLAWGLPRILSDISNRSGDDLSSSSRKYQEPPRLPQWRSPRTAVEGREKCLQGRPWAAPLWLEVWAWHARPVPPQAPHGVYLTRPGTQEAPTKCSLSLQHFLKESRKWSYRWPDGQFCFSSASWGL